MRSVFNFIAIFGSVTVLIAYAFFEALKSKRDGYQPKGDGKTKPKLPTSGSGVTPASYPRPGRRFDKEPRGM